jgi:hypothetical protein
MREYHSFPSEDNRLDDLLAQAHWPEPTAHSTEQLQTEWNRLRQHRPRQPAWLPLAAAAITLVAISTWWMASRNDHAKQLVISPSKPVQIEPVIDRTSAIIGRAPTPFELALIKAPPPHTRPIAVSAPQQPIEPQSPHRPPAISPMLLANRAIVISDPKQQRNLVDQLIAEDPDQAAPALLNVLASNAAPTAIQALHEKPTGWTDLLFKALGDPRLSVRQSAARALAQIDGPQTTARLESMVRSDTHRPEALTALIQIQSTDAQTFINNAEQNIKLRSFVRAAYVQTGLPQPNIGVVQ